MLAVQVSNGEISYVTSASLIPNVQATLSARAKPSATPCARTSAFSFSTYWQKDKLKLARITARETNLPWRFQMNLIDSCEQRTQTAGAAVWIFFFFFFHTYTVRTLTVTQSELESNRMISKPRRVGVELSRNTESNHLLGENRLTGSLDLIATCDIVKPNQSLYKEFISACNLGLLRPEGSKNTFSF